MQTFFTKILGVRVSILNTYDTLELIKKWLVKEGKFFFIATPNPEFLVKASRDAKFRRILNQADLAIPDGIGLVWASKILKKRAGSGQDGRKDWHKIIKERVSGTDLMKCLCGVANKKGLTIGLIGGGEKIAVTTRDCLLKMFPKLTVKVFEVGKVDEEGKLVEGSLGVKDFKGVDILFVALGMGKQEKWIAKNADMLRKAGVRIAMGVGGAFDYISGKVPRAPSFLRKKGLEWLCRLIRQPWRIKRQLALLEFARKVYTGER